MKIFVTGGHGFLGKVLCKRLIELGHEVTSPTSKDCNLYSPIRQTDYPISFDLIFHLAAWTQAGDFCLYHPGEQWINNQKINTNILEWWHKSQNQAKLIFIGTSCSYSTANSLVEKNYLLGEPIDSLYTYAFTKRMLLQGAMALSNQFGMKWLCPVPSTLYGPDYHTDGRQMHFIFDLIRKVIRAKKFGESITLWGDGMQKREILHVNDFVATLIKLVSLVENEVVNIGYGQEYTIKYYAETICDIIGYDSSKINYDTSKYVGAKSKCLSIEKVENIIPGYEKSLISINEGLKTTIDWFYTQGVV